MPVLWPFLLQPAPDYCGETVRHRASWDIMIDSFSWRWIPDPLGLGNYWGYCSACADPTHTVTSSAVGTWCYWAILEKASLAGEATKPEAASWPLCSCPPLTVSWEDGQMVPACRGVTSSRVCGVSLCIHLLPIFQKHFHFSFSDKNQFFFLTWWYEGFAKWSMDRRN